MIVFLNGKQEEVSKNTGLEEFLLQKGLCLDKIVVERNCKVVKRKEWTEVILLDNDILEVLSFVGGG